MLALAIGACAPASPDRGAVVAPGIARATFDAHSDGAEPFAIEVTFPSDSTGRPLTGAFPGVVLLPGGGLDFVSYRWLTVALARGGYVVAAVEEPHGWASLDRQRAAVARDLLRSDRGLLRHFVSDHIAVMGHALGGEVAANQAIGGKFQALVLLAASPSGSDAVGGIGMPSLVASGSEDCDATPADLATGWQRLPSPSFLAHLGGVGHLQFTDAETDDRAGCRGTASIDAAHAEILFAVQHFLDGALKADASAWPLLQAGAPGVTVEAR